MAKPVAHMFIPEEELERLREGSIENRNNLVETLAAANAEQIFGTETLAKVVASFGDSAIVVSESGDFRKLYFEATHDGDLVLTKHETVEVKAYSDENPVLEYHRDLARGIVDRLLDGDKNSFSESVAQLFSVVEGSVVETDTQLLQGYLAAVNAPKHWKTQIHAVMAEDLEDPLKFQKLYEGEDPTDSESFRTLVTKDMDILSGQLFTISSQMESALERMDMAKIDNSAFGESPSFKGLSLFAQDLYNDIVASHAAVLESLDKLHAVSAIAELHDTLFSGYLNQDRATSFITNSVDALIDAK